MGQSLAQRIGLNRQGLGGASWAGRYHLVKIRKKKKYQWSQHALSVYRLCIQARFVPHERPPKKKDPMNATRLAGVKHVPASCTVGDIHCTRRPERASSIRRCTVSSVSPSASGLTTDEASRRARRGSRQAMLTRARRPHTDRAGAGVVPARARVPALRRVRRTYARHARTLSVRVPPAAVGASPQAPCGRHTQSGQRRTGRRSRGGRCRAADADGARPGLPVPSAATPSIGQSAPTSICPLDSLDCGEVSKASEGRQPRRTA